ncbi:MAG: endopeptidase La [Blautia sp.]|nr:endopeptidase La [Blautia sp.]MCM1200737.1 endopeptidase La [Bacteroides fragilis]
MDRKLEQEEMMIPAVTLCGLTIFPDMIIHFDLSKEKSALAIEAAMMGDQRLFVVTQKNLQDEEPDLEQVYPIGTIVMVKQVTKLQGSMIRVLIEGMNRAEITAFSDENNYLTAQVIPLEENSEELEESEKEAMLRILKEEFTLYTVCFPKIGATISKQVEEGYDLGKLLDQIAVNIPLTFQKKQQVLGAVPLRERFEILTSILANEVEITQVKNKLVVQVKKRLDQNQKEYVLREQMRYIRKELGEDNTFSEVEQFEAALEKLKAGKEVKEKIRKEISRFKSVSGSSSESAVERAYLETLLELPWDKESRDSLDLDRAERILEEQHYGLEKVKERVLEFLAVRIMTRKGDSPIICLVGPPGTGKTSIAKSIAEALHKKYVRICLGGVRDEAEIRGHRKTYVGAMPGRIAAGLRQAGVKNPLMLLDEIDKVSSDYKGDTSSALLEVLDSEQNSHFRDHYVEIPLDLSEVLFIATANSTDQIPRPLLDRMEIIEVNSYTANEKFHIAKEHLLQKQLTKNGMSGDILQITDGALRDMIAFYTREAGVRGLERKIGEVCRKSAREILQKKKERIKITSGNLIQYLGKPKYDSIKANGQDEVGIVRGLAWTSVGGETLQIEVNKMPGKGEVDLTGQMGDVMRESALIAMSYVRSVSRKYEVAEDMFKENDFHLHIPEGAVPKDGPSAGITMAAAILSLVTDTPVRASVAMTGEITLRGRVLPVGGLKEKILAAKTAGMETVLVPKKNEKDIEEIAGEIKRGLHIYYVETMEDVVKHAFVKEGNPA